MRNVPTFQSQRLLHGTIHGYRLAFSHQIESKQIKRNANLINCNAVLK